MDSIESRNRRVNTYMRKGVEKTLRLFAMCIAAPIVAIFMAAFAVAMAIFYVLLCWISGEENPL